MKSKEKTPFDTEDLEKEIEENSNFCQEVNKTLSEIEKIKNDRLGDKEQKFDYVYNKNKELRIILKECQRLRKEVLEVIDEYWNMAIKSLHETSLAIKSLHETSPENKDLPTTSGQVEKELHKLYNKHRENQKSLLFGQEKL